MSSEKQTSMLSQIRDKAEKAKRDAVRTDVEKLFADYNKTASILKGIEAKIIEQLLTVGEDEATIRELLA